MKSHPETNNLLFPGMSHLVLMRICSGFEPYGVKCWPHCSRWKFFPLLGAKISPMKFIKWAKMTKLESIHKPIGHKPPITKAATFLIHLNLLQDGGTIE